MSSMTDSPGGGVVWLLACGGSMPGCSAAITSCKCCKQAANKSHFCFWLLQMHLLGVLCAHTYAVPSARHLVRFRVNPIPHMHKTSMSDVKLSAHTA